MLDRDNAVGIATRYELDSLGFEPRWWRDFVTDPGLPWAHPASCEVGTEFILKVRQRGRCFLHSLISSAKVIEIEKCSTYAPTFALMAF
jgi:hypothetical protein